MRAKDFGVRPEIKKEEEESTELALFVRTSAEEIRKWDRQKIYDALVRETDIHPDAARIIAREVEKLIASLEIDVLTAPLIRELTNAKLLEYGLERVRRQHTRLGVPLYDARTTIVLPNKENANVPHGPEATNLTLAERIKKEFALLEVFSQDIADAHMKGDIHLHDLGMCLPRDQKILIKERGEVKFVSIGEFIDSKLSEDDSDSAAEVSNVSVLSLSERGGLEFVDVEAISRRTKNEAVYEFKLPFYGSVKASESHKLITLRLKPVNLIKILPKDSYVIEKRGNELFIKKYWNSPIRLPAEITERNLKRVERLFHIYISAQKRAVGKGGELAVIPNTFIDGDTEKVLREFNATYKKIGDGIRFNSPLLKLVLRALLKHEKIGPAASRVEGIKKGTPLLTFSNGELGSVGELDVLNMLKSKYPEIPDFLKKQLYVLADGKAININQILENDICKLPGAFLTYYYNKKYRWKIPLKIKLNKPFARLLALFTAEGWYQGSERGNRNASFALNICNSDPNLISIARKDILELFKAEPKEYSSTKRRYLKESITLSFGGNVGYLLFRYLLGIDKGAKNKNLSGMIFNASKDVQEEFIRFYNLCDGYKRDGIISSSRAIIDGFSWLGKILKGKASQKYNEIYKENKFFKGLTSIGHVWFKKGKALQREVANFELHPVALKQKVRYDGYYYDLKTKTGWFLAGNVPILVHNCDRPYCSGNSIEYVKKFGLNLPNAISIAKPARHPEVLISQLIKFSAALQGSFAGAIGWDAVNLFLAPYLVGINDRRMKQLAQILVFEFAQQAVARGGQSIFSDLNLYWEVPEHFVNVPAIGPGGEYTGKTYGEYADLSQRFATLLFEVYKEGDALGRPFFFPKPNVHMTEKFFDSPGHDNFLNQISDVAGDKGNTYFIFDRGNTAKISECCRLAFTLDPKDLEDAKKPWKMRYSAMQNVTINLPRIAYEANGKDEKLFELLEQRIELVARAHYQKKEFITRLLALGNRGPLTLLAMDLDGEPYYRLGRATFLLGILGLNELVQYHTGQQLHESKEALKFGLRVIAFMNKKAEEYGKRYGLKMPLEQTPGESAAYRLAKLDLMHYPVQASTVVKGIKSTGEIYYTNSTYFNVGAPINPIDRVKLEGLFHPMIEAGALTHIWIADSLPSAESLANFVAKVFKRTTNAQIAFSPEFTSCLSCGKTVRGLYDECLYCNSTEIEGITRVSGVLNKIGTWNRGKLGELKERYRVR